MKIQRKAIRVARMAAPAMEPITIPAIAPPDNPWCPPAAAAEDDVSGGRVEVGMVTPSQRLVALDAVQQVSVPPAQ